METPENNGPYNIFAETEITVEFNDLDPMNVVWHGNYIDYFETGRRVLLEKIGYGYVIAGLSALCRPVIGCARFGIGKRRFGIEYGTLKLALLLFLLLGSDFSRLRNFCHYRFSCPLAKY